LKLTTLFLALLSVAGNLHAASVKPNILFMLTDDQGYGDLGRHGHPLLKTPNLDPLYDQGVRCENFYVSPSCSPTRAALLPERSGRREVRVGDQMGRAYDKWWDTLCPTMIQLGGERGEPYRPRNRQTDQQKEAPATT
jgi:hypothetical protein